MRETSRFGAGYVRPFLMSTLGKPFTIDELIGYLKINDLVKGWQLKVVQPTTPRAPRRGGQGFRVNPRMAQDCFGLKRALGDLLGKHGFDLAHEMIRGVKYYRVDSVDGAPLSSLADQQVDKCRGVAKGKSVFVVGAVVRLRSGGPAMTINGLVNGGAAAYCKYFVGSTLQDGQFALSALVVN